MARPGQATVKFSHIRFVRMIAAAIEIICSYTRKLYFLKMTIKFLCK